MVFRLFAHLAFGDGAPLFDPVIHYVPGNHDHHEWEITRENQYVTYVCGQPAGAELASAWHTTKLVPTAERPVASSALLTGLARSQAGGSHVTVEVSYPNLALRTPDGHRCLVVSHGHFTESIYTLMSRLRNVLYPDQRQASLEDIDSLEEENFAWIDFFWSTLGRSGQAGVAVLVNLAHRTGRAHRPGCGAMDDAVGVRRHARCPAPPAPGRNGGTPRRHAVTAISVP